MSYVWIGATPALMSAITYNDFAWTRLTPKNAIISINTPAFSIVENLSLLMVTSL
jgi:hypothetical protein